MTSHSEFRDILINQVSQIPDTDVALLLSAGIDSNSVMFALLEAGKRVTAYSFTMASHPSTDYIHAQKNAKTFGVNFVGIPLPNNLDFLIMDMEKLVEYGAETKTDFECGFPMLHVYPEIEEICIVSGMGADGHFCLSKKGMIHYKDRIDEFRQMTFAKPNYCQAQIHRALCTIYDKIWITPYLSQPVKNYFMGKSWEEINRPHQKQVILDAFPEQFEKIKVFKHTNFQKGDSGIDKLCDSLVSSRYNTGGHKSPVGIYNALRRAYGREQD
jgi:hypothetical protein